VVRTEVTGMVSVMMRVLVFLLTIVLVRVSVVERVWVVGTRTVERDVVKTDEVRVLVRGFFFLVTVLSKVVDCTDSTVVFPRLVRVSIIVLVDVIGDIVSRLVTVIDATALVTVTSRVCTFVTETFLFRTRVVVAVVGTVVVVVIDTGCSLVSVSTLVDTWVILLYTLVVLVCVRVLVRSNRFVVGLTLTVTEVDSKVSVTVLVGPGTVTVGPVSRTVFLTTLVWVETIVTGRVLVIVS
jgi:hypothetical protein